MHLSMSRPTHGWFKASVLICGVIRSVTIVETTAREIIKDESSGQVLGVICKKKGSDELDYVGSLVGWL